MLAVSRYVNEHSHGLRVSNRYISKVVRKHGMGIQVDEDFAPGGALHRHDSYKSWRYVLRLACPSTKADERLP